MTSRAAIYARFSSDRQNERSCADQVALCAAWAARHDMDIAATFEDKAVSGASTHNREGLASLMRRAAAGEFDVLVCEALDRLSRDQADLATLRKHLTFHGVAIHTVQDGKVDAMHIGLKGLMGELYLADLAQKTRRGLQARVHAGATAGGRSYGYDLVPGQTGQLVINDAEADVVRQIFDAYAAGSTPRSIAVDLNARAVPGPRGGKWNASTINGSRARQNGILSNRLYAGEIVWNRQRFIKNPDTGKRVSRLNPESEWVIKPAPELAIVDADLFARVAAIKAGKGGERPHLANKPRHVFSGLIKCGCCGASYTVYGPGRLSCAGRKESGTCTNRRTVSRQHVEQRVLEALQQQLADPEMIREYVRAYHAERQRLQKAAQKDASQLRRKLAELTRQIERAVDLVLEGNAPAALVERLQKMEGEKGQLEAQLVDLQSDEAPVALHPGVAEHYARTVATLQSGLDNITAPTMRDDLFARTRALIERITIHPTPRNVPVKIEVTGQLAALLSISNSESECMGMLVAGARNKRGHTYRFAA